VNPAQQTPAQSIIIVPGSTQSISPAVAPAAASLAGGGGDRDASSGSNANTNSGSGSGTSLTDGSAALQQLSAGASATSTSSDTSTSVPTMRVDASVDSAEFPQAVTDRVSFMVDNSWSNAKLSVNPPQLGPIELQIAVQGEHAQVMMSTHSALTRDALESSAPKLREMLNAQGFTHVNVDVSQRSFQERSSYTPPYAWTPPASSAAAPPTSAASTSTARASLGVLDAYA
jgi:flagellar hook-length control protein FliK